jgi:hypothetical protein
MPNNSSFISSTTVIRLIINANCFTSNNMTILLTDAQSLVMIPPDSRYWELYLATTKFYLNKVLSLIT